MARATRPLIPRAVVAAALSLVACTFDTSSSSGASGSGSTGEGASETAGTGPGSTGTSGDASSSGTSAGTSELVPWRRKIELIHDDDLGPVLGVPAPVLLRAEELDEILALGDSDGGDLRFVDADGQTVLAHEIERWSPGEAALIWVRVPQLDVGGDHIWMYGGDLQAAPGEDPAALWTDGHQLVLHMSDDPGDGGAAARNSAGAAGAAYNGDMDSGAAVVGKLGGALRFDGADDYLVVDPALTTDGWTGLTVSAWVRHAVDDDDRIVCKSPSSVAEQHIFSLGIKLNHALRVRMSTSGDGGLYAQYDVFEGSVPQDEWTHVAFTWSAATGHLVIYIEGTAIRDVEHGGTEVLASPVPIVVANVNAAENRMLEGGLDEVRVSSVARPGAWIATQHRAMTGQLVEVGPLEAL